MADEKLHPDVVKFREFLIKRPALIRTARKEGKGYQDLFEKWVLLGEDDPSWKQYEQSGAKEKEKDGKDKADKSFPLLDTFMNFAKKTDVKDIRKHAESLGETIRSLQEMAALFRKEDKSRAGGKPNRGNELFHVFRD